jgi:GNAT superfamily N-acetyltransferase
MIRPAEPADAVVIAELLDQLGYPTAPAAVPERLRRLRSEGRGEVYVSIVNGQVGGLLSIQVGPSLTRSEDTAYVSTLVVAEGVRGKGVGRELLEIAEAHARKHNCPRIVVATANHRNGAHAFYERLGWEWTGRRYAKVLG